MLGFSLGCREEEEVVVVGRYEKKKKKEEESVEKKKGGICSQPEQCDRILAGVIWYFRYSAT